MAISQGKKQVQPPEIVRVTVLEAIFERGNLLCNPHNLDASNRTKSSCNPHNPTISIHAIPRNPTISIQCNPTQSHNLDARNPPQSRYMQSHAIPQSRCMQSHTIPQSQYMQSHAIPQSRCMQSHTIPQSQYMQSHAIPQSRCMQSLRNPTISIHAFPHNPTSSSRVSLTNLTPPAHSSFSFKFFEQRYSSSLFLAGTMLRYVYTYHVTYTRYYHEQRRDPCSVGDGPINFPQLLNLICPVNRELLWQLLFSAAETSS